MNAREARQAALQAIERAKKTQYENIKKRIEEYSEAGYMGTGICVDDLYHSTFFPEIKKNLEEDGYKVGKQNNGYVEILWKDELEENEHQQRIQKENDIKDLEKIIKRWGDDIYDLFAKINKKGVFVPKRVNTKTNENEPNQ
jgi:hypothetical protein